MINDPRHFLIFDGLTSLFPCLPSDLIDDVVELLLELDLVLCRFDADLGDAVSASSQLLINHF